MNKRRFILLLILVVLGITSLIFYIRMIKGDEKIVLKGTVKFINLEGGFYGIIGDDGKNYLPINLSQEFKIDGTRVKFEGKIRKDILTIYMWGEPIEITKIEVIEK